MFQTLADNWVQNGHLAAGKIVYLMGTDRTKDKINEIQPKNNPLTDDEQLVEKPNESLKESQYRQPRSPNGYKH